MPWSPEDATRHTKKANTPSKRRQWKEVANNVLEKTGSEERAMRAAASVVKRNKSGGTARKR